MKKRELEASHFLMADSGSSTHSPTVVVCPLSVIERWSNQQNNVAVPWKSPIGCHPQQHPPPRNKLLLLGGQMCWSTVVSLFVCGWCFERFCDAMSSHGRRQVGVLALVCVGFCWPGVFLYESRWCADVILCRIIFGPKTAVEPERYEFNGCSLLSRPGPSPEDDGVLARTPFHLTPEVLAWQTRDIFFLSPANIWILLE